MAVQVFRKTLQDALQKWWVERLHSVGLDYSECKSLSETFFWLIFFINMFHFYVETVHRLVGRADISANVG